MSALKTVTLESPVSDLRKATLGFTAPFALYIAALAVERLMGLSPAILYPLRLCAVVAALLIFSRPYLNLRQVFPIRSVLVGVAVFFLWIVPDLLLNYRHGVLFENPLVGSAASTIPVWLRTNLPFLAVRVVGGSLVVPILEELFWRGWLMRWLVDQNFLKVPLGSYVRSAFWVVAILFASEHGPYWEVGLAAGIIYNWWVIRTKSLADCILAHATTNACLAAYVLSTGSWGYWL